jgi:BirA family biotin operon repressor/biotin-[acetyl-CoA-carboxylase] ligase|tara:strand:- start:527 stop:1123 length:597 start_codon:yes stop_codon:yes gene_type:complete
LQLDLEKINLKTSWIKREDTFLYFREVDSTIKVAYEQFAEKNERKIVITDCQINGIGSFGKKWLNIPYKDLALTIILGKSFDFKQQLIDDTCKAVVNTIKNWGLEGYIKKPNDIYIDNKKISGVLLNNRVYRHTKLPYQYLSVGLNVNSDADIKRFDKNSKVDSTSFLRETGKLHSREKILSYLIHQIDIAIQKQVDQ